jgi:hypothetical protein
MRNVSVFAIVNLQSVFFFAKSVEMFMFYHRTKFQLPSSVGSSLLPLKWKLKVNFVQHQFYITQKKKH